MTYTYNSDGVRVAETADGTTTYYLNDPQNPTGYTKAIEDRSGSNGAANTTNTAYILGSQVTGQVNATATYYLLVDGHGSTRALTSTTGGIVESYDFDAYGIALNFDPSTAMTNWLFGGDGLWDPNSLFTYHLARFRDGEHFISYDNFEADPTTPASLHKYLYASVNPVHAWDPTGQFGLVDVAVTMLIIGILFTMGGCGKPTQAPAANTYQNQILKVTVTPVLIVPKGNPNGQVLTPNLVRELTGVQAYWKSHAGINIQWNTIIIDNTGTWKDIDVGFTAGNSEKAIQSYYAPNGSQPVIIYGANIHDNAFGVYEQQGTVGYTPEGLDEGCIVQSVDAQTIAHELGHLLLKDGDHDSNPTNLLSGGEARVKAGLKLQQLILTQPQVDKARKTVKDKGWVGP